MDFTFANAWVLFFCWLAPALAVWWHWIHRRRLQGVAALVSPAMQPRLAPGLSSRRPQWQIALTVAGLFLMLIAAARPQWGSAEVRVFQKSRDLMILLDVSRSMLADDVHPNRLQRAKIDLMDLIKDLRGDRAGLIAFRFKAAMLCPLTTDYAYLRQALDGVSIDSAPRGETNIGDAIRKALDALESDPGAHKAMILISDGEDLTGQAVDVAREAGSKNIPIFTVGLGSSLGSRIPDRENGQPFLRHKGEDVVSKLDNQTLRAVAEATHGAHISIGTASTSSTTLGDLYRSLRHSIAAQEQQEALQKRRIERYQWFLFPSFILLLAAAFLSRGRLATGAHSRPAAKPGPRAALRGAAAALLALFAALHADAAETGLPPASTPPPSTTAATNAPNATAQVGPQIKISPTQAQRLFRAGLHAEAADAYLQAAAGAAGRAQHDYIYNAAVAAYQGGDFEKASDTLRRLYLSEPERNPETSRSLGLALYRAAEAAGKHEDSTNIIRRARQLREAGESFREASRGGTSGEALHNLAVILDQIPEADQQATIARLMDQYKETQAPQLADQLIKNQREIIAGIAGAFTNNTPTQIHQLEGLARQQKTNADLWIPLKGKLLQALAQSPDVAKDPDASRKLGAISQSVEATRDRMHATARNLKDMDPAAYDSALQSEAATYHFWKGIAPYAPILQEDILMQTNAIRRTSGADSDLPTPLRPEQKEAHELTQLFIDRFSQQVPEKGDTPQNLIPGQPPAPQDAANGTNAPPGGISAEDRKQILLLADNALLAQQQAMEELAGKQSDAALAHQKRAHDLLKEIEKLLPKDKQNPQPQPQPQQPPPPEDKPDQPQPQPPEEKKQEPPDDAKKMMEKALQREKDHEQEKQRKRKQYPMAPHERDW